MSWTMAERDEGRILQVVYQGTLATLELRNATHEVLGVMLAKNISRVLLDCAEAHMEVPAVDVYQLPDVYSERGISRSQVRAAVVLPKDGYKRDLYEFYEDVCRNRGYFVKLFETEADAWSWLRSDATPD
ncbi:MAG TPA: hypothetical protein VGN70_02925 [Gammaproteobacteria bacterium]|jgi:hypothetical protein